MKCIPCWEFLKWDYLGKYGCNTESIGNGDIRSCWSKRHIAQMMKWCRVSTMSKVWNYSPNRLSLNVLWICWSLSPQHKDHKWMSPCLASLMYGFRIKLNSFLSSKHFTNWTTTIDSRKLTFEKRKKECVCAWWDGLADKPEDLDSMHRPRK